MKTLSSRNSFNFIFPVKILVLMYVGSILIVIGLLVGSSLGFYEEGGDVVVLTESNFKSQVIQSSEVWLVEFFAPW